MQIVYRVQDEDGRGPFRPGFSCEWADEEIAPGMDALPTWPEEFGCDLIDRCGRRGEHFGTAVRSAKLLGKWFSATERHRLQMLGFNAVRLRTNRVLAESENQLVFARTRPLNRGAIIIPWPVVNSAIIQPATGFPGGQTAMGAG